MKKRKISKFLLATSLSIGSFSSLPFTAPTVYAKEESSSSYGVFLVDFDSETEGMELPDEDDFWAIYDALAGQFPTGTVHAGDEFDGEVDVSHLDNPVPLPTPIRTTYVPKDGLGVWTFTGWDIDSLDPNDGSGGAVGLWAYRPYSEMQKVNVTYEFEAADGTSLPSEVLAYLPGAESHDVNTEVTATQPASVSVDVNGKKWVFKGYKEGNTQVAAQDIVFHGVWEQESTTYKASYRFESGTDSMELPEEVKALLPSDDNAYENEAKVTSKAPSQTSVEVQDGTWNFVSYDEAEKTVNRDNVEFVGTWTYTPKEYHVVYHFGSGSDDYDLPQEVMDLLPVDTQGYSNHEVVSTILPAQQKVTVENGEWVFKGYDADTKTVQNANVSFIGTWVFEANRYPVSYRFVSLTSGLDLPEEVNILLPFDEKDYEDQTTVHVKDLLQGQVKVANGTWLFEGFDAQEKVVNHAGVEFVGTWKFVAENEENLVYYHGHYQFVSTDSQYNLPDVILSMLPNDRSDYRDGETVHAILPMGQKVVLANGTWTFLGYDASEKVVHGQDVTFVGRWEYTPAPTEKTPGKEKGQPTNKTSASTKTKRVNTAVGSMMSLWTAFGSLSAMLAVLLKRKKK
ncbi:MAG: SHIRT domain-containing protein [Faecalicoccus sp.]|uniref:SHIRT domain-containing protein n=3 Tax=Faecalicoccus TaxID=1573536 RepID=UPI002A7EA711|nr:SHIRT domain-containing protein [Faecalicoccus sp.]MCI6380481.1 SHIRT domain-containing protein [Erysipelotrichaceae bacterium]MDY4869980.1 SHIRT domain-containing protein [Faecalicoccus sp.]